MNPARAPQETDVWLQLESTEVVVLQLGADGEKPAIGLELDVVLKEARRQVGGAACGIEGDGHGAAEVVMYQAITQTPDHIIARAEPEPMLKVEIDDVDRKPTEEIRLVSRGPVVVRLEGDVRTVGNLPRPTRHQVAAADVDVSIRGPGEWGGGGGKNLWIATRSIVHLGLQSQSRCLREQAIETPPRRTE